MKRNFLNVFLVVVLLLSFLNRSLFVDMSEANFARSNCVPQTTNEINSVLEWVLKVTGYHENDIDEDGDSPENYASFQFSHLSVCPNFSQVLNNNFSKDVKESFGIFSDIIYSQPFYGQIDRPPES